MKICVFGAARDEIAPEFIRLGETLGRALARRGHAMLFGGGAHGMMGAAARGCASEGGEIIGVAPYFFDRPGVLFDGCTQMIQMETMAERKTLMENEADAFLALPGGLGTFDELFEVLTMRNLGLHQKPIALLDCALFWAPTVELLRRTVEGGFAPASALDSFLCADDAEACLDYLERSAAP